MNSSHINGLLEKATDVIPESLFTTPALAIPLAYFGHSVQALVDTGAQISVVSWECIQRLGLENCIDYQSAGVLSGVNSKDTLLGKVHFVEFSALNGYVTIPISLSVMQANNKGDFDMILGMDFLVRVGAIINLKTREVNVNGTVLPMVPHKESD